LCPALDCCAEIATHQAQLEAARRRYEALLKRKEELKAQSS